MIPPAPALQDSAPAPECALEPELLAFIEALAWSMAEKDYAAALDAQETIS